MTPREMEDKLRQYEYAFDDILHEIWLQAVTAQEQRHRDVPYEQIVSVHEKAAVCVASIVFAVKNTAPPLLM